MKTLYVYAKCSAGNRLSLQEMFSGSRSACERYIRDRVRMGRPTHFLFISSMGHANASARYL